jgi:hypothetical protein
VRRGSNESAGRNGILWAQSKTEKYRILPRRNQKNHENIAKYRVRIKNTRKYQEIATAKYE